MEPRVTLLTLGVDDVRRSRAFYVEALGWPPLFEVEGDVLFLQVGPGLLLSLYGRDALVAEAYPDAAGSSLPASEGAVPMTLAHNVGSPAEVDAVLATVAAAGATVVAPGQAREWGGYSGYFADPSGFRWEVAHNPGLVVHDDGTVTVVAEPPPAD